MMGKKSFVFRFDDVEVREREFSLLKGGKEVTVEPKAFRTLLLLLRNPQKLITKDELLNAVWGDTAVTEGSVTRCIWLLRRLLGDDINEPRYIATVATVGYRFVCAVEAAEDPVGAVDAPIQASEINAGKDKATHPRIPLAVAATAVIVAFGALLLGWWRTPTAVPVVESVTQLTDDPLPKSNLVTDGSRIYFNEGMEGSSRIAQVSIEGGPWSGRQARKSGKVKVLSPSIACNGRIAYPVRVEATKHVLPGRKRLGHPVQAAAVGAIWETSKLGGLNERTVR